MKSKLDIAVFGLGTFGQETATSLMALGHSVLAVDEDTELIEKIKNDVTRAVIADVTDANTLDELDIAKFDAVVLGMSGNFEDQVLCAKLLINAGVKRLFAKVNSAIQAEILKLIGVTDVIRPDCEAARRLARTMSTTGIVDMFRIQGAVVAQVKVKPKMVGFTLHELDLRNRHHINAIMIKSANDRAPRVIWQSSTVLNEGDELTVVAADEEHIQKIFV